MQETWVWSLGQEEPLEKAMATHSSILAWKIPWTEEIGRLQFMGSQSNMIEHKVSFKTQESPLVLSSGIVWASPDWFRPPEPCSGSAGPADGRSRHCSSGLHVRVPHSVLQPSRSPGFLQLIQAGLRWSTEAPELLSIMGWCLAVEGGAPEPLNMSLIRGAAQSTLLRCVGGQEPWDLHPP